MKNTGQRGKGKGERNSQETESSRSIIKHRKIKPNIVKEIKRDFSYERGAGR